MTKPKAEGWSEEFDNKFWMPTLRREQVKAFIKKTRAEAIRKHDKVCANRLEKVVKEERESWLYQKANEHDKRIREDERMRCAKVAREWVDKYMDGTVDDESLED